MKQALLALIGISATLVSSPSRSLTVDFSFTNDIGPVAGTVTGEIDGLYANGTNEQATHVYVQEYPAALSLPVAAPFDALNYADDFLSDSFNVNAAGQITSEIFPKFLISGF